MTGVAGPMPPAPSSADGPPPATPVIPAATAADLAAVQAASTEAAAPAPVKAKDLPPSHAADRLDASHRTTSDTPLLDGSAAAAVTRHPVAPVAPIAAKTGDSIEASAKALIEDAKVTKADEAGPTPQPTAPAAADHTAQAGATAAAAARTTPETVASLAAQIVRKAEGRSTRFDVELHPADLGRVDVRLEIGAQGRMTASMSFENPQAAAELRGRAHELQAALERAGFDVSGGLTFDVAGDRGQGGQNFAGQQQPDGGGASRGRAFQAALQSAGDTTAAAISGAFNGQGRTTSGVDIRI
jgi:flagellar hook-length control protein FliK